MTVKQDGTSSSVLYFVIISLLTLLVSSLSVSRVRLVLLELPVPRDPQECRECLASVVLVACLDSGETG